MKMTPPTLKLALPTRLIIYFLVVGGLALAAALAGLDAAGDPAVRPLGGGDDAFAESLPDGEASVLNALLEMLLSVATAIAFSIPIAMTYALTKRKEGYDRALVQMMVILPVVVSCVVLVVKGSLALAFVLTGIAALVRFRATFRDVKDAVFGFATIGVGLAAGVHSLVIAASLSLIFCLMAVALWKLDIGNIHADLGRLEGKVKLSDALVPVGPTETISHGEAAPPESPQPAVIAEEAARLEQMIQSDATQQKRKKRFTHLLLVHAPKTAKAGQIRQAVEDLLETRTKRWRFVSEVRQNGTRTLEFLARLKADDDEQDLLKAIKDDGRNISGVELKAVDALRETLA